MECIIRDDAYKAVTPAQQTGGQAVTALQNNSDFVLFALFLVLGAFCPGSAPACR